MRNAKKVFVISDNENYARSFLRGSAVTFIGLLFLAVANFLLRIFLARGLTKAHFGLFFAVFSLFGLLSTFTPPGFKQAINRFISKFKAEEDFSSAKTSFNISLVLAIVSGGAISLLLIVLSGFLASSYFGDPSAVPIIIVLSIWFFFNSIHSILTSVFAGFRDFLGRTGGKILRVSLPFILVVSFSYFADLEILEASFFYLTGPILSVLIMYFLLRKRHKKIIVEAKGTFSKSVAKDMLFFGLPLVFSGVAFTLVGRTDTLMLTGFRSLGDVGVYQVAKMSRPFINNLGLALSIPLLPLVSELSAKGETETLNKVLNIIFRYALMLVVPAALVFITFPHEIIRLLFGSEYIAGANAMRIMGVGAIFWTMGSLFKSSLAGAGESVAVGKVMGVAAAVNVLANLIFIPPFGATGAAIGTSISFLVVFALYLYYMIEEITWPVSSLTMVKAGLGGFSTLLVILFLKNLLPLPTWPLLFTVLIGGFLFYLGWLSLTHMIKENDIDVLESAIPIPEKLVKVIRKFAR